MAFILHPSAEQVATMVQANKEGGVVDVMYLDFLWRHLKMLTENLEH